MQALVEINKKKSIIIRTTFGLSYVFNKNDYKCKFDGTLKDTGESAIVYNGVCKVF